MKIKKTYIRSKMGLFVGLLSFQALSSCANTGRQLGIMGCCQSEEEKKINKVHEVNQKNLEAAHKLNLCSGKCPVNGIPCPYCTRLWYKLKKPVLWGTATVVTVSGLAASWYYLWKLEYSLMDNIMTNTTIPANATTDLETTLAPVQNMVNTTVGTVGSAATTLATVVTTSLPTLGILNALRSNGLNGSSSIATPMGSQEDLVTERRVSDLVTNPMVIDVKIRSYLLKNGFSKENIKYLQDEGLNIKEARDEDGRDLLMIAASKRNIPALSFLLKEGCSPNSSTDSGNTALHYFLFNIYRPDRNGNYVQRDTDDNIEKGCKELLEHGASPLKKNKNGKTALSYALEFKASNRILQLLKQAARR